MPDHYAIAVTRAAEEHVILQQGCPKRVITDNGRQFESRKFHNLMSRTRIRTPKNATVFPQCNPVERANRILKTMIA